MVKVGQFRRSNIVPDLFFHIIKVYDSQQGTGEFGACQIRTTEGKISSDWQSFIEQTSTIVE